MLGETIVRSAAILLMAGSIAGAEAPASPYGDMHWRELGPFRGGWATVVEGVPTQPDRFFFGAAGGGVWESDDAGRTWQAIFEHGPAAAVGALAVSPSNPNVIYVGTGQPEPRYDIGAGLGVFKTVDGGKSWTSLGLENTRYIGRIWVDPKNPNLVLVGAQGHFFGANPERGLYRSTDGGKTWTQPLKINDWTGIVDIASDPKDPKVIFASAWEAHQYPWQSYFTPVSGAGSALYKSTDEGATWHKISGNGWPAGVLGRIGIAAARTAKGTRVYAAVDSKEAGGLYRSDDGGAHWARVNEEDAFTSWYASRLTVAPNDPDVVYTVGQSIRRCDHGGKRCEIVKGAPGGDDYHHVWINPLHPVHMITGSDQGAVVSVNGGATWSDWYNEPTGQFYHLEADNGFPYWIYSGQQDSGSVGIASRSDYGELTYREWHPVGADERDYDVPDPVDPLIVYGSGLGGHVSKWDGHTGRIADITPWPERNYGMRQTLTKYHYMWMTPLVPSRTGPFSLYLGGNVLLRTQDRGKTWAAISGDLTGKIPDAKNCDGDVTLEAAKPCGYSSISAITPSSRHADEIWVGTDDGLIQLTRDGGAHWSNVTPPVIPVWGKIASVDLSAKEDGVAYAAIDGHRIDDFQPHVLRTRDYGASWQTIDAGLPRDHFVDVVRTDPEEPHLLYAGTDAGVFASFDEGDHWAPLQQNLPTAWVTDLLVHDGDLIVATEGRAIWVLDDLAPLREMARGIEADSVHLFAPAHAFRVHPNNNNDTPLPPETPAGENPPAGAIVDYTLGAQTNGPVTLTILDGAGNVVRRFASDAPPEKLPAEIYFAKAWTKPPQHLAASPGMHRFVWDLHYERPDLIRYGYGIAAVWGHGTPIEPQGPFALPGDYTVVLEADGKRLDAPLTIVEDPRIGTSPADLAASLALSQKIDAALGEASKFQREESSLTNLLDKRFPKTAHNPDPAIAAALDRLRAKPQAGAASFQSVAATLATIEGSLESADVAPTAVQQTFVDDAAAKLQTAQADWAAKQSGPLADLNTALQHAGQNPVTLSDAEKLPVEDDDEGQDLP